MSYFFINQYQNTPRRLINLIAMSMCFILVSLNIAQTAYAHQCRYRLPDQRNICLVRNEGRVYYCRYVINPDQNTYCYAIAYKNPKRCAYIQKGDIKDACIEEVTQLLEVFKADQAKAAAEKEAAEKEAAEKEAAEKEAANKKS